MTPYYQDDSVTIYHGDCREVDIPADLLLTDPPYGIGLAANPFRQKHTRSSWDNKPVDVALLDQWIARAQFAIVWGGNYFGLPAHQKFLVWDKVQPESFSSAMCELAWTNLEGPAKLFRRHVVSFEKWHPTQKPLELMTWCVQMVPSIQTVVDPFMGSGTVLVAAKAAGKQATGIEVEERYCEIAARRMCQEVLAV